MAEIRATVRPSFRDVQGRFTKANEGVLEDARNEMRVLGRQWVRIAQEEAPKGKTGNFARGIRFRTQQRGEQIELEGTIPQPLGTFITEGTKAHPIAARQANALRFFWPKIGKMVIVPKGGGFSTHVRNDTLWVGKGRVDHPGTQPNPFTKRAFKKWRPNANKSLRRIALNWSNEATS